MSKTDQPDEAVTFFNTMLEELLDMSDEDVLDKDDPGTLSSENMTLIANAKKEAGRRRMQAAKTGVSLSKLLTHSSHESVDINAARIYLQQATNDPRFTLAARSLNEMSDEDIFRLYNQMILLKKEESDRG